eukprot:symbB.v1.2.000476.t1/scaffold11.1/size528188/25
MFSVEEDRAAVARVLRSVIESRLTFYLAKGRLHEYRFLRSQQRVRFDGLPEDPIENLIPGFELQPGQKFVLSRFLYQNGFTRVNERDSAGWSPLCYAALGGDPVLIRQLLESAADPNDKTEKATPMATMPKSHHVLATCSFMRHNAAIEVLLEFKASPTARDTLNHNCLHHGAAGNNAEGVDRLIRARADPGGKAAASLTPFMAPRIENAGMQKPCAMEVANEFDRLYLPARKCRVNASLRDVGFSPVRCQLCGGDMKFGFFVIVMQCKHSFHLECFQDHFKEVQDNPQAADVGPGGYPRTDPDAQTAQFECRKPLLCPCAGCSRNLTFSWTTPN